MSWREAFLVRFAAGAFSGITLGRWLRVLRENHFAVDRPYWGRAAMITLTSIPNTLAAAWENVFYGRKVRNTRVAPPLFILGIWRSGTTHLHNLLTQDDRFAYPTTYDVFYPHTFLTTEKRNARLVGFFLPKKRPQDNMALGIREPQEDEFALFSLTGRALPMAWTFPRRADHYGRYLTLRGASASEVAEWKSALAGLVRKLAFKYGRPLVLKSPGHTCRIRLLLELFPQAKFVHIHRNPYDVFRSTRHLIRTVPPWWALQRPDYSDLEERSLR
ncbi:MAG TPA: sulfotransferase, partial [Gemmataceae bacterium]